MQGNQALLTFFFRERLGACHVPGRHVREPEVTDFSFAHEVVQCGDDFFNWSDRIPGMQPIKVDVVGLQPAQGAVQRAVNILAPISAGVRVSGFGIERKLCCQYDAVTQIALGEKLADHLLAFAAGVSVGGVDEVSPASM